jgi:acyl-CoA thioesterase-1
MRRNCFFSVKTLLLAITISSLTIIGCKNGTTDNDNGVIVCFGDSLTEGYGATTPGIVDKTKSYPAFFQNKVKSTVVNAGKSGDTSAQGRSRMNNDVLSKNPKIVIIEFGANDFFTKRSANEAKADLQAIINALKGGDRKIYLASFLGDAGMESSFKTVVVNNLLAMTGAEFDNLLSAYKTMFSELESANSDIGYISNFWTGIWGISMSDYIHPNATGYATMANNIFTVMEPYLQEQNLIKGTSGNPLLGFTLVCSN